MADQLITDEDLVALYCGGAGCTPAVSHPQCPINTVLEVDATTFTRGTLPLSDVADIHPVAVNAL